MTDRWNDIRKVAKYYIDLHGKEIPGKSLQIIKMMEELGEVSNAFFGSIGANPRKGVTCNDEGVALEIADLIGTAMVAMFYFSDDIDDPERIFDFTVDKFMSRLNDAQNKLAQNE